MNDDPLDEVEAKGTAPSAPAETAKSVTESLAAVAEAAAKDAAKDPETPKKRKPKVLNTHITYISTEAWEEIRANLEKANQYYAL